MHSVPNPRLDAALAYASDGLPVLPIWLPRNGRYACGKSECPSPAKHSIGALVPHGLKDATTDAGLITRWWTAYPEAKVAIVTGRAPGRDVVDVDGAEGSNVRLTDEQVVCVLREICGVER